MALDIRRSEVSVPSYTFTKAWRMARVKGHGEVMVFTTLSAFLVIKTQATVQHCVSLHHNGKAVSSLSSWQSIGPGHSGVRCYLSIRLRRSWCILRESVPSSPLDRDGLACAPRIPVPGNAHWASQECSLRRIRYGHGVGGIITCELR